MTDTRYCIAYTNSHTQEHAENAGLLTGWVKLQCVSDFPRAKEVYDFYCGEFSENTAVAVFISRPTNTWYNTKPRRLHNGHVLVSDSNVRAAFGGLVNTAQSGVI